MKIIDISADLFSAAVYPGDPAAGLSWVQRMEDGADYNLSAFSLCSHNATHMDAPLHFLPGGGCRCKSASGRAPSVRPLRLQMRPGWSRTCRPAANGF